MGKMGRVMTDSKGSSTVQRELAHLRVTLLAFDNLLDKHFSGEEDEGEARTNRSRLGSARAVLLKLANDIVDQFGPFEDPTLPEGLSEVEMRSLRDRVALLWDVYSDSLEKYGIVKTEDGKMFTFAKTDEEPSNAG